MARVKYRYALQEGDASKTSCENSKIHSNLWVTKAEADSKDKLLTLLLTGINNSQILTENKFYRIIDYTESIVLHY